MYHKTNDCRHYDGGCSYEAAAVKMASKVLTTICVLLSGLVAIVGGKTGQYRECYRDEKICFTLIFNFDGFANSSLKDARESCRLIGSRLAEIRSSEIQNYTSGFLQSATSVIQNVTKKNVIVDAMRHHSSNDTWFWVNGDEADNITWTQGGNQTVDLMGNLKLVNNSFVIASAAATSIGRGFICEYPNATMAFVSNCTFQHDDRCFVFYTIKENWFSARNFCLDKNGDLASLEFMGNTSLYELLNTSQWFNATTSYWIGLRQSWWMWEGSGSEARYTNWRSDAFQNSSALDCISLSYKSSPVGQWTTYDCDGLSQLHYLCLYEQETKSTPTMSTAVQNAANNPLTPRNTLAIGLGVGLGVIVVLLIIVIAILVILIIRRRLITEDNTSSQNSLTSADQTKSKRRSEKSLYEQVQKQEKENGETHLANPAEGRGGGLGGGGGGAGAGSIMSQPCYATVKECEDKSMASDDSLSPETQIVYAEFDISPE